MNKAITRGSPKIGFGGALFSASASSGIITNCIFWNDSAVNVAPEIYGRVSSIRYSVVQGGYPGTPGPIFTGDPLLGSFGDYGGPVPTIPIDTAGSAYNTGTLDVPSGVDISTDARGLSRSDGMPDIGAFEVQ